MSSNNDIINNGVTDYGICCDECGYFIEDDVTGYWRDNVTGIWNDVRYCEICVWDFVNQPKRITAQDIWEKQKADQPKSAYEILRKERQEQERQVQARLEQERLSVPESERRRIREEREERERQYQREYEEEMEEREREREEEEEARRKKNAALNNILAKQEVARLQKKEQEKERECMEEEDYDWGITYEQEELDPYDSFLEELKKQSEEVMDRLREEEDRIECSRLTCEYTGQEEQDPQYDYDSLQSEEIFSRRAIEEESNDWIQAYANKFWSPPTTVSRDGELSRSYDWDPKPEWAERRACCEILDHEILDHEILDREILDREILDDEDSSPLDDDHLPHQKNLVSYRALKQSNEGFGPIVSAIRVFDELCISNILFDSLVDLCEFY
jgi:hypothetical protein